VVKNPRGNLGNFDVPPSSSTGCPQNQKAKFFLVISWCLRDLVAKILPAQRVKKHRKITGANWGQIGAFQGHFGAFSVQNRVKTVRFEPISKPPILTLLSFHSPSSSCLSCHVFLPILHFHSTYFSFLSPCQSPPAASTGAHKSARPLKHAHQSTPPRPDG